MRLLLLVCLFVVWGCGSLPAGTKIHGWEEVKETILPGNYVKTYTLKKDSSIDDFEYEALWEPK